MLSTSTTPAVCKERFALCWSLLTVSTLGLPGTAKRRRSVRSFFGEAVFSLGWKVSRHE